MRVNIGVCIVCLLSPVLLEGSNLGIANPFNTFVFTDINPSNLDAPGRVAAGNNVTYTNFIGRYADR